MLPVDDYQQLENMLWQTARRFQALIESSSDIVLILDVEGIFRYASPSMQRILGYPSEKLIGKPIQQFTHLDDVPLLNDSLKTARHSPGVGLAEIEIQVMHQDGTWRVLSATFNNLLENESIRGLLVNCHEITLRKETEEKLKRSEQRLQQLITSISDHVYVTELHPEGYHVNRYISPNTVDLTGYPIESLMADRFFWSSTIIHPDDRAAAAIQAAYLDMGRDSEMEYRIKRADGKVVWVRDSAKVYLEDDRTMIYGIISDISERKRLESQLLQAQKIEAISRLAGGIAHDFNNLLTVVIGNCQLILDELDDDNPHKEFIEQTYRAGSKAAALTNQLLTFSRQQVNYPQPLDLNTLIINMDYTIRRLLNGDIDLVTILEPNLAQISADMEQLERVIINLVLNARNAMPKGGEVTIKTANRYLDQNIAGHYVGLKPGYYVRLTIEDIGLGMDEVTKSHFFEPYYSTSQHGDQSGLGLATVYGIVRQNGGHIWVESSPGRGTQVDVYLPRLENRFPTDTGGREMQHSFRRGATILMVSAENESSEQAQQAFINAGHMLLKARDGQEAFQVYKNYSGSIDLLVIEYTETWDQVESQLAQHLQSLHPEMRVLLLKPQHYVLKFDHKFKTEQLAKPFTSDGLVNKVTELLRIGSPS